MVSKRKIYGFCDAGCKRQIRDVVSMEISLTVAGWSDNKQTVTIEDIDSTCDIIVSPKPSNSSVYSKAGVQCISQGTGTLTFSCKKTPTEVLAVSLLIVGGISE